LSSREDCDRFRTIQQATRSVGVSLDWFDHGGGERAWTQIRAQPAVVRAAYDALSSSERSEALGELIAQFERFPEQYWGRLEDAALTALARGSSHRATQGLQSHDLDQDKAEPPPKRSR